MSRFNELSQAIGTAIHKATKQSSKDWRHDINALMNTEDSITSEVLKDTDVYFAVKELVEHTIKQGNND